MERFLSLLRRTSILSPASMLNLASVIICLAGMLLKPLICPPSFVNLAVLAALLKLARLCCLSSLLDVGILAGLLSLARICCPPSLLDLLGQASILPYLFFPSSCIYFTILAGLLSPARLFNSEKVAGLTTLLGRNELDGCLIHGMSAGSWGRAWCFTASAAIDWTMVA